MARGSGPIVVKPSQLDLPICDAFLAAAGEAGFPVVDELNADVAEGFGRIEHQYRERPPSQHRGCLCATGQATRKSRITVRDDRRPYRDRKQSSARGRDPQRWAASDDLGGA